MRRPLILAFVALLGLSPLMGVATSAQEGLGEWPWEGVESTAVISPDDAEWERLTGFVGPQDASARNLTLLIEEGYRFHFENRPYPRNAYVPEINGAELLVVFVEEGEFILDVKGRGSYLVDPAPILGNDGTTVIDDGNLEIYVGEIPPDENEIYYERAGDRLILDENGNVCGRMCTVLPGYAVKLQKGDRVIAPAGGVCVWCLFQEVPEDPATPPVGTPEVPATGDLLVFPLVRTGYEFSWLRYMPGGAPESSAATPTAGRVAPGALRALPEMAVMAFNPGPGCSRSHG